MSNISVNDIEEELKKPFLYQNHVTSKASSTPISTQQLCRILCPMAITSTAKTKMPIQPDSTLLIGFDPVKGEFCAEGWRIARSTPVLREACCNWYYEGVSVAVDHDDGNITGSTNNVKGPISCRELSRLYNDSSDDNGNDCVKLGHLKDSTRVWSPEMAQQQQQKIENKSESEEKLSGNEWKSIVELPLLKIAMEAFVEAPMPWSFQNIARNTASCTAPADSSDGKIQENRSQQMDFDPAVMVCPDDGEQEEGQGGAPTMTSATQRQKQNQDQDQDAALLEFLSSTGDDDKEDEEYVSDGGTTYVKDHRNGNWIHADLLPDKKRKFVDKHFSESNLASESTPQTDDNISQKSNLGTGKIKKGNKKKKTKFKSKNSKCWIYITNLPPDTTQEELTKYFSKVGIIDLDPETQKPKVKLYRYRHGDTFKLKNGKNHPAKVGQPKGDASICYARPESVELALQLLDDSNFRPLTPTANGSCASTDAMGIAPTLSVQRAKFAQHGNQYHGTREVSNAKRRVTRLAALQAIGWDEGDNGRITGGLKGLRIIVLKYMFTLEELRSASTTGTDAGAASNNEAVDGEDVFLRKLEQSVLTECEKCGVVEKITAFSKNVDGIMVVKFTQPTAASKAIEMYDGRVSKEHGCRKIDASYWDGVSDFTVHDEVKEEADSVKRLDEFGDWLDTQELPDEFRLKVEE